MKRIGLIDLDYNGSFPNMPLMKLSAYHKAHGDSVEWYNGFEHYDIVYVAKVFSWTQDYQYPINADKVVKGGSGYHIRLTDGKEEWTENDQCRLWLPMEIEHIYPDYSLYPSLTKDTAYGFLTRGCPRGCGFCHVAKKEGYQSRKVADLSEFWHGQKNIVLCDPNILACKDWRELLQQLIDSKATLDINQGLDIRMMTNEKADMLCRCKIDQIHFAWDRYEDGPNIIPRLRMFRQTWEKYRKWNEHGKIVYTLVNFDTTKEQDLERIYTLRDLGYWAYVMVYDKANQHDQFYKDLQRWVNNRIIFAKCARFEDYNTTSSIH